MAVTSLYSTSLIGTLLENLSGYGINKTTGYFQGWVWNFQGDVSLFLHFHIILVGISSPAPPFFSLLCPLRKEVGTIERSNIKMPPGVRQGRKWTGVKPRGRVGAAKLDRMGDNVCPQSRGDSKFWKTLNSRTETHPGSFCSQPHSLKKLSGTFPRFRTSYQTLERQLVQPSRDFTTRSVFPLAFMQPLSLHLQRLLNPKHGFNFWNFRDEWDLPLPWASPGLVRDRHLKRDHSPFVKWKRDVKRLRHQWLNWCCLGVGKKC